MRNAIIPSLLLWALIIGSCQYAFADDDCRGNSCNGGGDVDVTTGDVNVGVDTLVEGSTFNAGDTVLNSDSKSLGLANGLGDVDIADCLGSQQWNSPLFGRQKLVLNKVCMAEFYLRNGKYKLAAMQLCNVPEILSEFDTEASCESAHDFTPPPAPPPPPAVSDEHRRQDEMYAEQLAMVQMQLSEIETRVEKAERKPAPRPAAPRTIIEQTQFIDDDKRAKLRALRDEDE